MFRGRNPEITLAKEATRNAREKTEASQQDALILQQMAPMPLRRPRGQPYQPTDRSIDRRSYVTWFPTTSPPQPGCKHPSPSPAASSERLRRGSNDNQQILRHRSKGSGSSSSSSSSRINKYHHTTAGYDSQWHPTIHHQKHTTAGRDIG